MRRNAFSDASFISKIGPYRLIQIFNIHVTNFVLCYSLSVLILLAQRLMISNINVFCRLNLAQLILGVAILMLHIVSTVFNDEFSSQRRVLSRNSAYIYFHGLSDNAGTGVWVGLVVSCHLESLQEGWTYLPRSVE